MTRIAQLICFALAFLAAAVPPATAQLETGLYTVNAQSCVPETPASVDWHAGEARLASGYTNAYLNCPLPHVGGGQYNTLQLIYTYTATGWDGGVVASLHRVPDSTGTDASLASVTGSANATAPRLVETSFSHTFALDSGSYYVHVVLSRETSGVTSPRFYTARLVNNVM